MHQPKALVQICQNVVALHLDAVTSVGDAPYFLLEPVLIRASAVQLEIIEEYSPKLVEDTDQLWHRLCLQDFFEIRDANEAGTLMGVESWRELYLCKRDEREREKMEKAARLRDSYRKLEHEKRTRATKLLTDDVANRVLKRAVGGGGGSGWGSGWNGGDASRRSKGQMLIDKARMQARKASQKYNIAPIPTYLPIVKTNSSISVVAKAAYPRVAPSPSLPTAVQIGRRTTVSANATAQHHDGVISVTAKHPPRQEMSPPKTPQGSPTSEPGDEHVLEFFKQLDPTPPTSPPPTSVSVAQRARISGREDKPKLTIESLKRSMSTRPTIVQSKRPRPTPSVSEDNKLRKKVVVDPAVDEFFRMLNGNNDCKFRIE